MPSSSQTDFDMSWHEEEPSVFTRSPFDEYFTGQSQIRTVVTQNSIVLIMFGSTT